MKELVDIVVKSLPKYEKMLEGWKDNVSLYGKNLESAAIDQISWMGYYDEIKIQLKTLLDYVDMAMVQEQSRREHYIRHNIKKTMSESAIVRQATTSDYYLELRTLRAEVYEMYSTTESIVNQLKQRAYSINNIIKIRESELQGITLFIEP